MPDGLDASLYELPESALTGFVGLEAPSAAAVKRAVIVAQLRERIEQMQAQQQEWARQFDKLYDDAVERNFNTPFLMQWASALLEKERAALEALYPFIEALQDRLIEYQKNDDHEMQQLCIETIDVIFYWIRPYQGLTGKLLELADARRDSAGILRARPVKAKIDYAALIRDTIARFPKILAALAK